MAHISRSIEIARSPDAVFAMLTDLDRLPDWAATVVDTRHVSHADLRPGSTFHQTFRLLGQEIESEWRVTEYDPPHRIGYTATSPLGGRLRMTQIVTPAGNGSQVALEVDYELPGGFVGQVFDGMYAERHSEQQAELSLEALKRLLERDPGAGASATEARRDA